MKLVIGGAFQGKEAFVREQLKIREGFADGTCCSMEEAEKCNVLLSFHELIRRLLLENRPAEEEIARLLLKNPSVCIVTNELGYGVVPIDPFDRKWREKTGRICTQLASEAEQVYRVVCGIGMELKSGRRL